MLIPIPHRDKPFAYTLPIYCKLQQRSYYLMHLRQK